MASVAVLMSTYNGEEYIEAQIQSILEQQGVEVELYIRDDGSTDRTKDILSGYKDDLRIHVCFEENVGATKSFWKLLTSDICADYYAFADQDDIWLPQKLKVACEKLGTAESGLYFSNLNLVDRNLNKLGVKDMTPVLTAGAAVVTNRAFGCTIVINEKLRALIKNAPIQYITEHDTKVYQIAVVTGSKVVFDQESYILYRQHGNNVVGAQEPLARKLRRRIKNILVNKSHIRKRAAEALLGEFDDYISKEDKEMLGRIANPGNVWCRIKTANDKRFSTGDVEIDRNFKIALLLNLI